MVEGSAFAATFIDASRRGDAFVSDTDVFDKVIVLAEQLGLNQRVMIHGVHSKILSKTGNIILNERDSY